MDLSTYTVLGIITFVIVLIATMAVMLYVSGDEAKRAQLSGQYKMTFLGILILSTCIGAGFAFKEVNDGKSLKSDTLSSAAPIQEVGTVAKDDSATKNDVILEDKKDTKDEKEVIEVKEEEVAKKPEKAKPTENPRPKPVEEVKEKESAPVKPALLSNDVIAKQVLDGKWGNGAARRANLENEGYNYAEIQAEVDKIAPKPQPKPTQQATATKPTNSQPSAPVWAANRVYMAGGSMPYITSNYDNMVRDIDAARGRWVTSGDFPVFNPNDNHGTYFAAHNGYGGDVIMSLGYGSEIIVTDGSGTPHTYVVDNILRDNKQEHFDDALSGRLDKEYIVFQTCEYPETRGNIHVFATKR